MLVLGILGALSCVMNGDVDPYIKDTLLVVSESAEHMLLILDDILLMMKSDANQLELRVSPFDLRVLLMSTVGLYNYDGAKVYLNIIDRSDDQDEGY
eukprot:Awhi_evm1s2181